MSIEMFNCLKRQRDITVKSRIPDQNTTFMVSPPLNLYRHCMLLDCENKNVENEKLKPVLVHRNLQQFSAQKVAGDIF